MLYIFAYQQSNIPCVRLHAGRSGAFRIQGLRTMQGRNPGSGATFPEAKTATQLRQSKLRQPGRWKTRDCRLPRQTGVAAPAGREA